MNIVIVLGNGFDLDLGWDTSYKSFYDKHKGWGMHKTDEDDLFQYVIKQTPGNWFDFERTLHEYALHRAEKPYPENEAYKHDRDIHDYNTFKEQLARFITEGSKLPVKEDSDQLPAEDDMDRLPAEDDMDMLPAEDDGDILHTEDDTDMLLTDGYRKEKRDSDESARVLEEAEHSLEEAAGLAILLIENAQQAAEGK